MRVAILDDYLDAARDVADWSSLAGRAEITTFTEHLGGPEAAVAALADFEIVVAMRERQPLPATVIEKLPKLKLIVTTGMRNQSIDIEAAKSRGIAVCGTRGNKESTTEQTWAMIMGLVRNIPADDDAMHGTGWQTQLGFQICGRTLGLLGLGSIGAMVAKVGLAFGMNVIAWSQNLTEERASSLGVRRVEKDELFAESDILSVHVVLGDRTRGLVGAHEIGLMRPTAYLVNTSRAPIVDYPALVNALDRGALAGAALDVYDVEPLPTDSPLRRNGKLLLTPHMGYVTDRNIAIMYTDAIEDIEAFLNGKPVRELG